MNKHIRNYKTMLVFLLLVVAVVLGFHVFSNKTIAEKLKIESLTPPSPAEVIDVWVRHPGLYDSKVKPQPLHKKTFWWKKLKTRSTRLFDHQYQKKMTYLGIQVSDILKAYKTPSSLDLALLHFANGMRVPFPLKPYALRERKLHVFIAIAYKQGKRWSRDFPEIRRDPVLPIYRDLRPIQFKGNKVVVADEWHPDVLEHIAGNIKLWNQVDTLTGIELVHAKAYYQQFLPKPTNDERVQKGWLMYKGTCHFCHSVREVGGRYGIDFVQPLALYLYAWNTKELHYHITYKPVDAISRGIMMPAIKDMPQSQVEYLWHWVKQIATTPMHPYTPPTSTTTK